MKQSRLFVSLYTLLAMLPTISGLFSLYESLKCLYETLYARTQTYMEVL